MLFLLFKNVPNYEDCSEKCISAQNRKHSEEDVTNGLIGKSWFDVSRKYHRTVTTIFYTVHVQICVCFLCYITIAHTMAEQNLMFNFFLHSYDLFLLPVPLQTILRFNISHFVCKDLIYPYGSGISILLMSKFMSNVFASEFLLYLSSFPS